MPTETPHPDVGLSPRVRGNRIGASGNQWRIRSIPACAGEPDDPVTDDVEPGVYPRVCGGTGLERVMIGTAQGLSPRVRGNRLGVVP